MSARGSVAAATQALLTPGRLAVVALGLLVLGVLPLILPPFDTLQVSYGLILGIAALGFNLLLGYTGLLSFGHSAFFGTGAYAAAFLVKYWGVRSMEAFIVAGVLGSLLVAALIGAVCVRYTRIFFGILALALSQVLWSLAMKLFWVTGGTDGLRVPTPTLLGGAFTQAFGVQTDKTAFLAHRYYYYVLAVFVVATAVMWVIVHSPFGKALQAIRDNEVRAEFVGVQVRRYRYVAFLVSGAFTGLAGVLWVPLNGLTTPEVLYWPFSGRIVFMAVLGGFRTFWGPDRRRVRVQLPRGVGGQRHRLLAAGPGRHPRRPRPDDAHGSRRDRRAAAGAAAKEPPGMSLLEIRNITKSFGDNRAVDDVTLTIQRGEFLGLIGSNGAGKTTLVNLISGFFPADRGALVFDGHDITRQSINERIRVGIARSFQLVNLFDQLTVLDNVALTIFARQGKTRWLWTLADRDGAVRDEAVAVLRQFGLEAHAPVLAGSISQGERKLLDVAVAYALRPKLLFLDEPTSGVSTREKAPIMDIITAVVRAEGITAVVIEHDMDIVFRYSDRIVAMHQGAILASGTPDEIRRNEQVAMTLLGTHADPQG